MKKYLVLLLVLTLAFVFASCGVDTPTTTSPEPSMTTTPDSTTTTQPDDVPVDPPVDTHEHSYTAVVTEPTCTEQGYTTYTCYTCDCGDTYIGDYVDATGHSFGEWVTVKDATTTEEGLEERHCECGEKETQIINKLKVSEGLEFTLNDDESSYSVTGIGTCTDTDIVIPNTINDLPVTSIGDWAFFNCTSLTSVTIPDSVTSIGDFAFTNSITLTSVEVDENNQYYKSIDGNLYSKDGATLIQYAIGKQNTSFIIQDSVSSIGGGAFNGCASLTSVTIGDSVTSIGSYAFSSCSSLTSIEIPNSVTSIGKYAFSNCTTLENVTIGDCVTSIGEGAFGGCASLTSVTIGDCVTSIGINAFHKCTSLTSIVIPDSVTYIGDCAFWYCTSLTSITIPDSVTSIGTYAFWSCDSLSSVKFEGTVEQWNAINKGTIWNIGTGNYTIYCFDGTIAKDGTVTYN